MRWVAESVPAMVTFLLAHMSHCRRLTWTVLALLQIAMGSTNVRVGSTIFGARDYSKN